MGIYPCICVPYMKKKVERRKRFYNILNLCAEGFEVKEGIILVGDINTI